MSQKLLHVECPQCRQKTLYDSKNPNRPFCSERCAQIDLGKWASEEYRIPEDPKTSDNDFLI